MVIRILAFFLVIVLCAFSMPERAFATPSVGTGVTSSTAWLNKIVRSTPGVNNLVIGPTGVSVVASGETAVAARGIVVPIAAEATAGVTAGRIAGVIAKGVKVGSWVGIATVVAPWIMDQAGIKVCPPPDFFCKVGPDIPADPLAGGWYANYGNTVYWGGTMGAACEKAVAAAGRLPSSVQVSQATGAVSCYGANNWFIGAVSNNSPTCPPGSIKSSDGKSCTKPGPDVPAPESEVGQALEDAMLKVPSRMGTAFNGLQSVNAPIWSSTDPVTIKLASPTTTAPVETRVETVPKPDGSIDTVKTEVKTEVKPVVTGTNLGDTKVDYPTTITTTTTTTNNVTNVTTTTTNVTNIYATPEPKTRDNPPDPGPPPPIPQSPADVIKGPELKIPDDYNREVTQKAILQQLDGSTVTVTPADQEARTKTEVGNTDKSLDSKFKAFPGEFTGDKMNWFSWVWTPPVGQCSASMFSGSVGGFAVNWDICPWVEKIRELIGFLFALFGAINIYSNLFRRGDN